MDATDIILPSKMSYQGGLGSMYEEEVRLFYVGVTRAKHRVTFLTYRTIFGGTSAPSRFIGKFLRTKRDERAEPEEEIDAAAEIMSPAISKFKKAQPDAASAGFREGVHVIHVSFGSGVVQAINPNGTIIVEFDRVGIKKLLLEACIAQKLMKPT
ncbi:MAG: hypothetical protein GXY05_16275, partial [Clostridiales bacterium]|nr:hypothetical protein [Clostridiales bacterium]